MGNIRFEALKSAFSHQPVTGDGLQVTGARKVMKNGVLLIEKNGVRYFVTGQRVE